jgi:transcriptional regulator with XRE-family HTH domain
MTADANSSDLDTGHLLGVGPRVAAFLRHRFPHHATKIVARSLHVSAPTAERWLSGRTPPTTAHLERMAELWGEPLIRALFPEAFAAGDERLKALEAALTALKTELVPESPQPSSEPIRLDISSATLSGAPITQSRSTDDSEGSAPAPPPLGPPPLTMCYRSKQSASASARRVLEQLVLTIPFRPAQPYRMR